MLQERMLLARLVSSCCLAVRQDGAPETNAGELPAFEDDRA